MRLLSARSGVRVASRSPFCKIEDSRKGVFFVSLAEKKKKGTTLWRFLNSYRIRYLNQFFFLVDLGRAELNGHSGLKMIWGWIVPSSSITIRA